MVLNWESLVKENDFFLLLFHSGRKSRDFKNYSYYHNKQRFNAVLLHDTFVIDDVPDQQSLQL